MSTVVLVLNQDGISELIQTANDLQSKVDNIMSAGKNKSNQDRIGDAGASSSLLDIAKEKLPIIMEEGDDETEIKSTAIAPLSSSKRMIDMKI